MVYEFKCAKCGKDIQVNQPIMAEHNADCPDCDVPCQRIYPSLQVIWAGSVYRPDGSLRQDSDYAILKG